MKRPKARKSLKAYADLREAAWYLEEQQNERLALRFIDAAEKTFLKLASMPSLGAFIDTQQLFTIGVRTWVVKGFERYVILYREIRDGIEVLRVLHGARKWEEMLDEE